MTTSEKIRKIRKDIGISQKEVAEHLGITPSNISQIENGTRGNISYETIVKLSSVFSEAAQKEISVRDLAGDDFPSEYWDFYYHEEKVEQESWDQFYSFYKDILDPYSKLNGLGQRIAAERLEELTKIADYRKTTGK